MAAIIVALIAASARAAPDRHLGLVLGRLEVPLHAPPAAVQLGEHVVTVTVATSSPSAR